MVVSWDGVYCGSGMDGPGTVADEGFEGQTGGESNGQAIEARLIGLLDGTGIDSMAPVCSAGCTLLRFGHQCFGDGRQVWTLVMNHMLSDMEFFNGCLRGRICCMKHPVP